MITDVEVQNAVVLYISSHLSKKDSNHFYGFYVQYYFFTFFACNVDYARKRIQKQKRKDLGEGVEPIKMT